MTRTDATECFSCHSALPSNANFCSQCGERVRDSRGRNFLGAMDVGSVGAERRQLTVLYCDLVSYTTLANVLDPEDLTEVVNAFQRTVKGVIEGYGSSVGGYRGDGCLIYFGYPLAAEDDAHRAVQAALDLVDSIGSTTPIHGVRPEVRVGVATGVAVIGEVVESVRAREVNVVGRVPSLANRLQSIVAPNTVAISDATYQLVGTRFECVDLGLHMLRGFGDKQRAWRVVRELDLSEATDGSGHPQQTEATAIVGRTAELGILRDAWQNALTGRGSMLVVTGEPGIGKSRLCRELRRTVSGDASVLQCFCSPRFTSTALFPVLETIRFHAKIRRQDEPIEKARKLDALLRSTVEPVLLASTTPYVASALELNVGDMYPLVQDAPELLKARTFDALLNFLECLARKAPLLLIVEDAHWADPTTLDLLDALSRRIGQAAILTVIAARRTGPASSPQFLEKLKGRVETWGATEVPLPRLAPEDAGMLVEGLTHQRRLPPRVVGHLLGKGDGVPLFIEEMTKAIMALPGLGGKGDFFEFYARTNTDMIPATLQESLAARLDQLGAAKDVARAAAVIGREFSHELLEAVAVGLTDLETHISQLEAADLLHSIRNAPQTTYRFKHALIRDAAYAGLLKSERSALHAKVAAALEAQEYFIDQEPEFAAHHFTEAGLFDQAIPLWERAAQRAHARAAYEESVSNLSTAIGLLPRLPDSSVRDVELRLQVQLGQNLCTTMGYAAAPVEAAYRRARQLAEGQGGGDDIQYDPVRGLCTYHIVRGEIAQARLLSEQCLGIAERTGRVEDLVEAGTARGYIQFYMGEFSEARITLEELTDRYHGNEGQNRRYASAQDPAIAAYTMLSHNAWMMGLGDEADAYLERAFALDTAMERPFNAAYAECYAAMLGNLRESYGEAEQHAQRTIEIAEKYGIQIWLGAGRIQSCVARLRAGQRREAIPELRSTLEFWDAIGARLLLPWFLGQLALAYRESNDVGTAFDTIQRAIGHAESHAETFALAELLRIKAGLTALNPEASVDTCLSEFNASIARARSQRARTYEARAIADRCSFLALRGRATDRDREMLREAASFLSKARALSG